MTEVANIMILRGMTLKVRLRTILLLADTLSPQVLDYSSKQLS